MQLDMLQTQNGNKRPEDIRILVACEKSGVGREAFLKLGFDAWSCDLQASDDRSNRHMQVDVRSVLSDDWDFLMVAHPPCTRLCASGLRWLVNKAPKGRTMDEMYRELDEGCELFSDCWNADIPHIAVENPIMHHLAKSRIRNFKPAKYVQPWWFGDAAFKATGWHLKNLPMLVPTNKLTPPKPGTETHKLWSAIHRAPPSSERSNIRSKTFQGHANAFADQWGAYIVEHSITDIT